MWPKKKLCLHVKRSGEEFGTQTSGRRLDRATGTFLRLSASVRSGGVSVVGLFISIRAGNDDLKCASVTAKICSRSRLNAGSPKGALEVGDAGWAGTVVGRIQGGISLDVQIETGAQRGVVAPLRASKSVVAGESMEPQVRVCGHTSIEVFEGFLIARWCFGLLSPGVKLWVGFECCNVIWRGHRSIALTKLVTMIM